jgi:hypothetical protein
LRALRSHDVERKVGWAINIGRALAGVAGVDIPELDDVRGLGDVQRATETLRSVVGEIEALRAQAETIMLARFVVPLAQPTAAGTSQVLVPSPEQDFVYVWAPGDATEASVVAAQVREGRLHQIEDRVYRVDPALGCSAGETSCPFHGAYLLWHVEASNNQHFTRAAWAEIGTAADAVAGGEVPNLGAFGALMTQGSLRDSREPARAPASWAPRRGLGPCRQRDSPPCG